MVIHINGRNNVGARVGTVYLPLHLKRLRHTVQRAGTVSHDPKALSPPYRWTTFFDYGNKSRHGFSGVSFPAERTRRNFDRCQGPQDTPKDLAIRSLVRGIERCARYNFQSLFEPRSGSDQNATLKHAQFGDGSRHNRHITSAVPLLHRVAQGRTSLRQWFGELHDGFAADGRLDPFTRRVV